FEYAPPRSVITSPPFEYDSESSETRPASGNNISLRNTLSAVSDTGVVPGFLALVNNVFSP
ncbi:hypothetical protein, partial [Klebsiella pneumoniae]